MIRTLAGALATTTCIVALATPAAAQTREFNIPAGSLRSALDAFARQSGRQVIYRGDEVRSARSPGVRGARTAEDALNAILAGTGFETRKDSSGAFAVAKLGNAPATPETANSSGENSVSSNEIVVTGTNIKGQNPVGSHVTSVARSEIQRSGYANVQDYLRTLPQNFGGGVSEDTRTDAASSNFSLASAINLRGLGPDATLVLVNGRRQPTGGFSGSFVDVSSIPVSALERVEILPDGASAVYGSDAVGGVINFVLRKDFEGAETSAQIGSLSGDATQYQLSQTFGRAWGTGHFLLGYQFYQRDNLARTDRPYSRSDDLRPFGGTDFRTIYSNPGNILSPLTFAPAYAIPANQDGTQLTPADLLPGQINLNDSGRGTDLLPRQIVHSAYFDYSQQLNGDIEVFADGRFGRRSMRTRAPAITTTLTVPASNPFFVDPFGGSQFLYVTYSFLNDLGPVTTNSTTDTYVGTLGANARLGSDWRLTAFGSYGREKTELANSNEIDFVALANALADPNPLTAFNPFSDGGNTNPATLDAIRGSRTNNGLAQTTTANATLTGSLFDLPSGPVRVALGAEYRRESIVASQTASGAPPTSASSDRDIEAIFGEASIPIVTDGPRLARSLRFSAAARYEHYSDFGDTFNPRLGAEWKPFEDLTLRGSWGHSFKAPRLVDLLDSPAASTSNLALIYPVADPSSFTGISNVLIRLGGNPDLRPEKATTWTLGAVLRRSNFRLSADYYNINYRDRIAAGGPPGNPFGVLTQEPIYSSLINRNPTRAEVDAICASPQFIFGDCTTLPAAIADLRLRNIASVRTSGIDIAADAQFETGFGRLGATASATYVFDFKTSETPSSPTVDLVNTLNNVPSFRARGTGTWSDDHTTLYATLNYTGPYRDNRGTVAHDVSSWLTVDAGVEFQIGDPRHAFRFGVSAVNLFDRRPPFADVQSFGYDPANADPYGRIMSVRISKGW